MDMKGKSGTVGAIVLLAVLAGGSGILAYRMHSEERATRDSLEKLQSAQQSSQTELDNLKKASDSLQAKANECATSLDAEKATREQTEKLANDTAKNLDATRSELDDLRKEHAENEKRAAAFKAISDKLRKMIDAGKLDVKLRGGQMVVKLPAEVLFASGSAELSKDGQGPLSEIASVLKQFSDRRFLVAGHTDNVPVTDKRFKNNWELSVERALSVVDFLVGKGMKPSKLVAAGHGEFEPVATNGTEAGRKENRRIEIILLPNLAPLPPSPEPAGSVQPAATKAPK